MNNEVKEVVSALLAGRTYIFSLLHTLLGAEPTADMIAAATGDAGMQAVALFAQDDDPAPGLLTAALELRCGNVTAEANLARNSGSMVREMTAGMLFDYMAILLDKQALADQSFTMNVTLTDTGERYMLRIRSGVLLVYGDTHAEAADVSITCPKDALLLILGNEQARMADAIGVEGDAALLTLLAENLNQVPTLKTNGFNIIEP